MEDERTTTKTGSQTRAGEQPVVPGLKMALNAEKDRNGSKEGQMST